MFTALIRAAGALLGTDPPRTYRRVLEDTPTYVLVLP